MSVNYRTSTVERRKKILQLLSEKGQVFVLELSKIFNVSEVTIRNDLDQLEKKNMLLRARGGAIKLETSVGIDHRISEKDRINYIEKEKIGKKAALLIKDGDTIIIDSGTTTVEIIKNIKEVKDLTVITNALNIANYLVNNYDVNLIMPGGYLRKNSLSLVGPLAEKGFKDFYVDKVFLGVDGFDTKKGIYTPNIEEAHLNEIMISIAQKVILVTDSSKFSKRSLAFICGLDKIHTVVTDDKISKDDLKRLKDTNIEVLIA